jgi:SAM-dependent methyltransferase
MESLDKLGAAGVAYHAYLLASRLNPIALLRNAAFWVSGSPDGLPLPPMALANLVIGTVDLNYFLESGRRSAGSLFGVLRRHRVDPGMLQRILDFGCGCGRVLRHLPKYTAAEIHGTDVIPELVEWCRKNLSSLGKFYVNSPSPPMSFLPDEYFDLVYALSVFTQMPEELQLVWMAELRRVLKPGGYLVISSHGERYIGRLTEAEKKRFREGELIVKRPRYSGSNLCTAFHPDSYVRRHLAQGFLVLDFLPEGERGIPNQDLYLLVKK